MSKILILGGGQQGHVIGADLADQHDVTVADLRPVQVPGAKSLVADLSDPGTLAEHMRQADLVVGALPAKLGFEAAKAAIAARRNYVDVAFYAEDASELHHAAKAAGIAVVPDCGLSPGISNLIIGRALHLAKRDEVHIRVGGVAADKGAFLGHVTTFSPEDLVDEYVRPARYIKDGKVVTVPALAELEVVEMEGIGEFEAFFTDGLRTLLNLEGVSQVTEKTMRWPGHKAAIEPLLARGVLLDEIAEKCQVGTDLVVLKLVIDGHVTTLVEYGTDAMTAMARTTALTTAAFARWFALGNCELTGVVPPEMLGRNEAAYLQILDDLQARGVRLEPAIPFGP